MKTMCRKLLKLPSTLQKLERNVAKENINEFILCSSPIDLDKSRVATTSRKVM
jgi:hypothetical protein